MTMTSMLTYIRKLGARWGRMIVGPILTVVGFITEFTGRFDEFPVGPYVVNVWLLGAVAALFVAQYKLWQDERADRKAAEERLRDDVVLRGPAPTAEDIKARRAAEQKRDRGEKLTRQEREILARPGLGVTRPGILESLGRNLTLGQYDLDLIRWAGEKYQKDWPDFVASKPDQEEVKAWLEERLSDRALESSHKWERGVHDRINEYLNYSFVSWFENDSGLTAASPPPSLTEDYFVGAWQHHEMRLQRLQEIIEELHRKWS